MKNMRQALAGVSGVHVTPYQADGAVDRQLLARLVRSIAAAGVHNIISGGNTGEFYNLTPAELDVVQSTAIEANDGKALLTVAVGRSLPEAKARTGFACSQGADAVMIHHPADPFAAPSAQLGYFLSIAEASPLPVVAYMRSDALSAVQLSRLAGHPNVAGIKFATTNLQLFAECAREAGEASAILICGLAESWAPPFYSLGARGFTSGLVNVAPERSLAIHAALERGEYAAARGLIAEIAAFEQLRTRHNNGANVTVVKEALTMRGLPVGSAREPNLPSLDSEGRCALAKIMKGWGLRDAA